MRNCFYIMLVCAAMLLTGCEGINYRSSVPTHPVHLEIDTHVGMYIHFVPENVGTYLIADAGGIHLNGITQPLTVMDAYGYAGTIVYIDGWHPYAAYDLCCPNCLRRDKPCVVDGIFAVCPICGEKYDLASGTAAPINGIAHETLRIYRANYNTATGKLLVTLPQ